MIGGSGEKKTLRLVAQYADACNIFGGSPEEVRHKLDVLRGHCDDAGRDPDTIEKTMIMQGDPTEDPDAFLSDDGAVRRARDLDDHHGPADRRPGRLDHRDVRGRSLPRLAEV